MELQIFQSKKDNFSVRTIKDDKGNIYFVAKDVAQALEYSEASNSARLFANVPEIWKGVKPIHTPGGEQKMLCLTEQGLYFFLGRSDKQKALPYQMWIAGDVVPSIRQTGFYATQATAQQILNDPDVFIEVLKAYKEQKARNTELKAKNEFLEQATQSLQRQIVANKPKVIFADAVNASKDSMLIGNFAKFLKQNGVDMGQNRLFDWFRKNGYLMNVTSGERKNMPTQKSMDLGLFEVKKTVINNPDGSNRVTHTPKITSKGQIYFINLFLKEA